MRQAIAWEFDKGQGTRLIDVLLLTPFLLWVATRQGPLPEWSRAALLAAGFLSIARAGGAYLLQESINEALPRNPSPR